MSSVAAPPVEATPTEATPTEAFHATADDASEVPATATNNAGTAGDATNVSAAADENLNGVTPEEAGHKVFAGNLAYATTDEGLKTFFSAFTNDVISSEVIQRGSRPAGYGFVSFRTLEAAEKAVADLNDKELDGRPVIVQLAKPSAEKEKERNEKRAKRRTTGRRNARAPPGEVTEAEAEGQIDDAQPGVLQKAENAVEGAAAAVGDALKPKKKKKNNRKAKAKRTVAEGEQDQIAENGELSAADAATGAAEATPKKARKPKVPRAPRAPRAAGEQPEGQPSKNMLFVANLAFSIDDARLKQIFTDAGINVVSARVVQRRWGARRSKGFGFVDVGNEEEQTKALAYFAPAEAQDGETAPTGKEVEGRQIAVKIAVDAPKREPVETDADAAANSAQKDDTTPDATVVAT